MFSYLRLRIYPRRSFIVEQRRPITTQLRWQRCTKTILDETLLLKTESLISAYALRDFWIYREIFIRSIIHRSYDRIKIQVVWTDNSFPVHLCALHWTLPCKISRTRSHSLTFARRRKRRLILLSRRLCFLVSLLFDLSLFASGIATDKFYEIFEKTALEMMADFQSGSPICLREFNRNHSLGLYCLVIGDIRVWHTDKRKDGQRGQLL